MSGATIMLNINPTCCGLTAVPSTSPIAENAAAPRRATASTSPACERVRPGIGPMISRATGRTKMAETSPCSTPETIFSIATSAVGTGARSRSSISFVAAKSITMGRQTAWMALIARLTAMTPGRRAEV